MRIQVSAVLAAAVLTACGGGDDRARTVSAPTQAEDATQPASSAATEAGSPAEEAPGDFSEVLLTLDDMPSGWTTAPEMLEDDEGEGTNFCGAEEDVLDLEDESERTAEAAFKESDFGPFVMHFVGELEREGLAEESLDTFLAVAEGCTEWTETDEDGAETTWRLSPLSFPNLGDGSVAFRMSGDGEMPISMDLVMWHEGRRLALIAYVALGATDAAEFERLALEAADRL